MRILYDCFSCSPYYGSDEGIGWNWPFYMRQYHEVWALVRKDRKPDIDRYCKEHKIRDIHFVYVDVPDCINIYYKNFAKGKNGTLDFLLYQFMWQFPAYKVAKKLHKKYHFDMVHHVSTNDFRLIGRMDKIGIPFIIGPIGGAQETPKALQYYVREHRKNEELRSILNRVMTSFPGYKKALNKADKVFFSNEETMTYLLPKIKNRDKCEILTEVACKREDIFNIPVKAKAEETEAVFMTDNTENPKQVKEKHNENNIFTMMWAGRMEYRKGLELLFDVLDTLPEDLQWKLILCGDGSESAHYKELVSNKTYSEKVIFKGKLPYEEVQQVYEKADIFVFPSLRETTGTVIIEAMAHGIPVIAIKQGGAAEVITEKTGFLVEGKTKEEIIENYAAKIEECIKAPCQLKEMQKDILTRVHNLYTWDKKIEYMDAVYNENAFVRKN